MRWVVHCKKRPYDVYVRRPGPWGNPFVIGRDGTRSEVVAKYQAWIEDQPDLVAKAKAELQGKVLACWCVPYACHSDVLARLANSEED